MAPSLHLERISPLYGHREFEVLYTEYLARDMDTPEWVDMAIEERKWVARYMTFSTICKLSTVH